MGKKQSRGLTELKQLQVALDDLADFLDIYGFDVHKCSSKQQNLLMAFTRTDSVVKACAMSGTTHTSYYRWCRDEPEFQQAVDRVIQLGVEFRRGRLEIMVDKRVEYSDKMLMWALERIYKTKYGRPDAGINLNMQTIDFSQVTVEELRNIASLASRKRQMQEEDGEIIDVEVD